jgi:predicted DNA-binding transcriptional regulator AlpA
MMRHVVNLKKSEIYISAADVMARYGISRATVDRWISKRGFPIPRKIVGKRHFLLSSVDAWDALQSGHDVEPDGETALGLPINSGIIQNYDEFVQAMVQRRKELALSCIELDARSGMQEGYSNKLENWRKDFGRGMGSDTFPLWLGGLRVGIVLVSLPRRPRKGKTGDKA